MNFIKAISLVSVLLFSLQGKGQSFFSSGEWFKVGVKEEGVYKLDKQFLEGIGIDVSDPKRIAVFGGDGRMLPQENSATVAIEPKQVPTLLLDTGAYSSNFQLLFYNDGAKEVSVLSNASLSTELNIYTDTVYYYVGYVDQESSRITVQDVGTGTHSLEAEAIIYTHYEEEEENLFSSGRVWLSNKMNAQKSAHTLKTKLYKPLSDIDLKYDFVGTSTENTIYFNLLTNDSLLFTSKVSRSNGGYGVKTRSVSGTNVLGRNLLTVDTLDFTIQLDNDGDVNAYGYLNYLSWQYFTVPKNIPLAQSFYLVDGGRKITVSKDDNNKILWGVNLNNREQKVFKGGELTDSIVYFLDEDTLRLQFVNPNKVAFPIFKGKVESEDINSVDESTQLLIVYHESLKNEVLRFKAHKESIGIRTELAEVGDVFDQYSNGKKDISAVRNYVKFVYENTNNLKYLLLFGDCSYDYKDRQIGNSNMIPVYQSNESYHNVQTFSSDDYYGFLEDSEGLWQESGVGNHTLDISVGRFPVRNEEEAKIIVDKYIRYETSVGGGGWKNQVVFVADDEDDGLHVKQANELVKIVEDKGGVMSINKQYLDAFNRTSTDISIAKEQLLKTINEGAMFVNFTGHGSEYIWMSEEILTIQDIKNLENGNKLPVFITATCEFGRYDDPKVLSGAEALLISDVGAIALVTTTRPVYSSSNFAINKAFYNYMFTKGEDGKYKTMGEVFSSTKNNSLNGVYNRNFSLLGDPSLVLKLPNRQVDLTMIDDDSLQYFTDTIHPGEVVNMSGEVANEIGVLDTTFNGTLEISILESTEANETKGYGGQATVPFESNPIVIYKAMTNVVNGKFTVEVAMPVEISNALGASQIMMYAYDFEGNEALGVVKDVIIGGDEEIVSNTIPEIEMVLLSESLESNYSTNVALEFIFTDDFGILMSDVVIGKETTLILNGVDNSIMLLNDRMELMDGSAKKVRAQVDLDNLTEGENILEVRVWDIHGESSKKEFVLNVGFSNELEVFPNPVYDNLTIVSKRTFVSQAYEIDLTVFNHLGEVVFTEVVQVSGTEFENNMTKSIENLGINEKGVYYYDVNMRYIEGSNVFNQKGKIIKL